MSLVILLPIILVALCMVSACAFVIQNKKSKKYLGGTFTAPTFNDSGTFYIVQHA
jgi:hypothetical protein